MTAATLAPSAYPAAVEALIPQARELADQLADLVGHSGTSVTEKVYRHQLRPVLLNGAQTMDKIFGPGEDTREA